MKLKGLFTMLLLFTVFTCENSKTLTTKVGSNTVTVKVMTYNIRLDTENDKENAWSHRKAFLSSQIRFLSPDVLGVQEALPNQIEDLNKALMDYKSFGEGRDGGSNGEHSAIYYNSKTLKVDVYDTFWLSETPDTMSKGWDAALPRICTYGLFSSLSNGKKFWVFNTHFDHVGAKARKESVKLILKKIEDLNKNNHPVVLMGDLNVEPDSDVIKATKEALVDAKDIAKISFGNDGTFNGFRYNEPSNRRIDYILLSKSAMPKVEKYAVFTTAVDFKFPSDHFPVFVELILK
ncbi:endonuclease/exonuclease/phosphatase family protein [Winogradskyella luteola]|uniref:Endonuclease/exonuclease/phosphatase family protein n=1 Tax=Winogradskyella luteola TaxID=2828330 RepID=A0A9X1FAI0_9FLAO|nr:endonuclease/exonuclease/phosphatase family protein [Winogradskyella luteola]MBV7269403.1 endonuclease/exonuclease/phosphatase family protein [Winogradskyella luteola]